MIEARHDLRDSGQHRSRRVRRRIEASRLPERIRPRTRDGPRPGERTDVATPTRHPYRATNSLVSRRRSVPLAPAQHTAVDRGRTARRLGNGDGVCAWCDSRHVDGGPRLGSSVAELPERVDPPTPNGVRRHDGARMTEGERNVLRREGGQLRRREGPPANGARRPERTRPRRPCPQGTCQKPGWNRAHANGSGRLSRGRRAYHRVVAPTGNVPVPVEGAAVRGADRDIDDRVRRGWCSRAGVRRSPSGAPDSPVRGRPIRAPVDRRPRRRVCALWR